jgi:transcription elongation GreA/GreB family factor
MEYNSKDEKDDISVVSPISEALVMARIAQQSKRYTDAIEFC